MDKSQVAMAGQKPTTMSEELKITYQQSSTSASEESGWRYFRELDSINNKFHGMFATSSIAEAIDAYLRNLSLS